MENRQAGFFDLKGCLQKALGAINVNQVDWQSDEFEFLESGQSAKIMTNGKEAGFAGKVPVDILRNWGIKQVDTIWFAQLDIQALLGKKYVPAFDKISEFPEVVRDISLAVDKTVTYRNVCEVVEKNSGKLLTKMTFIEEYLGDKIPDNQRGLVFSLHFQSQTRTLTEDEVNISYEKVCEALVNDLGAIKR
jgi:phenylalanyl-tRNA synthetase beta chain